MSKQAVNKLDLKEDPNTGVYVKDLTSYVVKSVKECDKLRDFGANNRYIYMYIYIYICRVNPKESIGFTSGASQLNSGFTESRGWQ